MTDEETLTGLERRLSSLENPELEPRVPLPALRSLIADSRDLRVIAKRKPVILLPLQEKLASVLRLRKVLINGHDDEGNMANHLTARVLADEERALGRMFADWCIGNVGSAALVLAPRKES